MKVKTSSCARLLVIFSFLLIFILLSSSVNATLSSIQWYKPLDQTSEVQGVDTGLIYITQDNISKMQGTSSIMFEAPSGNGEAYIQNTSVSLSYSYPPLASTLGFYAKFTTCPNFLLLWSNYTLGSADVGFMSGGNNLTLVYDDLYYQIKIDTNITLTSLYNSFHWYEIQIFRLTPVTAIFFLDGIQVGVEYGQIGDTWQLSAIAFSGAYSWLPSKWWIDYIRINEGEEYPPYLVGSTSSSDVIDITQIPLDLSNFSGLPFIVCQIIATLILLLFAELIVFIFATDNILIITMVGLLVISIGVGLGWLPFLTMIIPIMVSGLLLGDVFRKWITGTH